MRHVRDPIHGFIEINETESKIIDSPAFQRLRRIKQLAFAYLGYPGAHHTRFEHSLGVFHVVVSICKSLNHRGESIDSEKLEVLKYAALLHDIGHGPFSHVSEDAFKLLNPHKTLNHELFSQEIIKNDEYICRVIAEDTRDKICKILSANHDDEELEPFMISILSGLLDADKQDYFLRDSYFCGVKYGVFDIHQLHRELRIQHDSGKKYLAIAQDGVHAIEQFLLAKYYLTTQVIRHKIRLITDQMLLRAIILGINEDNIDELSKVFVYNDKTIDSYIEWDDNRFINIFNNQSKYSGSYCFDIINRINNRQLFKCIYKKPINFFSVESKEKIIELSNPENISLLREIESSLSDIISEQIKEKMDKNYVIVNVNRIDSVYKGSIEKENDPILVIDETGKDERPYDFDESTSTVIKPLKKELEIYLEVYVPIKYSSSSQKRSILNQIEEKFSNIIEEKTKEE